MWEKNPTRCQKPGAYGVSAIGRPPEKGPFDRFQRNSRISLHFGFWRWTLILAGPKERFIAPSWKTSRASVESPAVFSCERVLGPGSSRRGKSEKLALSVPGEWQLSLTSQ